MRDIAGKDFGRSKLLFRNMMSLSTLKRDTGQPPGDASVSSMDVQSEHSSNSLDDAAAMMVVDSVLTELTIVMPDGFTDILLIDAKTQVMDALVQIAAAHKLNPAQYKFTVVSSGGRTVDCKPSQQVGSLGATTLHLVNKKASKEKHSQKQEKSFEVKTRLQLNLPHGQLFVTRVSSNVTLAEIFKMVCDQKRLDPYKHELRHPTKPDLPLNMADQLSTYGVSELTVVNITVADSHSPRSDDADDIQSVASTQVSNWTSASMAVNRIDDQSKDHPIRRKKGLLSLFSRKKDGKFRLSMDGTGHARTSGQGHLEDHVSSTTLSTRRSLQFTSSQPIREQDVPHYATLPKPIPRQGKKRPAPPPPAPSQVSGSVVTATPAPSQVSSSVVANGDQHHREDYVDTSICSEEVSPSQVEIVKANNHVEEWRVKNNNNDPSPKSEVMSLDGSVVSESTVTSSVSQTHRPRQRKKRKAPSPPVMSGAIKGFPEVIPELPEATSTQELSQNDSNVQDQITKREEQQERQMITSPADSAYLSSPESEQPPKITTLSDESQAGSAIPGDSQAASADENTEQKEVQLEKDVPNVSQGQGGGILKSKKSQRPSIFQLISDTSISSPTNDTRPCQFVPPPPPATPPSPPPTTHAFSTQTSIDMDPSSQDEKRQSIGGSTERDTLNESFSSARSGSSGASLATVDDIQQHFASTIIAAEEACKIYEDETSHIDKTQNRDLADNEERGHVRAGSVASTISSSCSASITNSYDVQLRDDTAAVNANDSDLSENSSVVRYDFTDAKILNAAADVSDDDDDIVIDDKFIDDILADADNQVKLISQRSLSEENSQIDNDNNISGHMSGVLEMRHSDKNSNSTKADEPAVTEEHVTVVKVSAENKYEHIISETATERKVIKPAQVINFEDSDTSPDLSEAEEEQVVMEIYKSEEKEEKDAHMSSMSYLPECEEIEIASNSTVLLDELEKVESVSRPNISEASEVSIEPAVAEMSIAPAAAERSRKPSPGAFIRNAAGSYTVTGLYFKEQNYDYTDKPTMILKPKGDLVKSVDEFNSLREAKSKQQKVSVSRKELSDTNTSLSTVKVSSNKANIYALPTNELATNSLGPKNSDISGQAENVREKCPQMIFKPRAEEEVETVLEEKSISMMARFSRPHGNRYTSEPQKEAINAALSTKRVTSDDISVKGVSTVQNSADKGQISEQDKQNENERLQSEYKQLQSQFSHWQEQLARNRAMLSQKSFYRVLEERMKTNSQDPSLTATSELSENTSHSRKYDMNDTNKLSEKVSNDNLNGNHVTSKTSQLSSEKDTNTGEATFNKISEISNNTPPPPPPPILVTSKSEVKQFNRSVLKKTTPMRPKFEPQLDPREELMIAIREAGGRAALKKVPVSKTRWYERKF